MSMIGEKGKLSEVNRVIEIKMYDNFYEPNVIKVKKGETIKFKVYNFGEFVHEFNIATKEMHLKHQPEMMKLVENEILLADKIDKKITKLKSLLILKANAVPTKTGDIAAGNVFILNAIIQGSNILNIYYGYRLNFLNSGFLFSLNASLPS